MTQITITCPHCGFAKDLPRGKVPAEKVRVTCPKCKGGFDFHPVDPAQAARVLTAEAASQDITQQSNAVETPPLASSVRQLTKSHLMELLLSVDVDWPQFYLGLSLLASLLLVPVELAVVPPHPMKIYGLVMHFLLASIVGMHCLIKSQYFNSANRDNAERKLDQLRTALKRLLTPEENLVVWSVLKVNHVFDTLSLLLLTNQRILLLSIGQEVVNQVTVIGYDSIRAVAIDDGTNDSPASDYLGLLDQGLKSVPLMPYQHLKLEIGGRPLRLSNFNYDFLWRVWTEIQQRQPTRNCRNVCDYRFSGVQYLCGKCLNEMQEKMCPVCRTEWMRDYLPVVLSILFPGLGQLYLRKLKMGTVLVFLSLLLIYLSVVVGPDLLHPNHATVTRTIRQGRSVAFWFAFVIGFYWLNLKDAYSSGWKLQPLKK